MSNIVIAGGGAAGFFAAITCAEKNPARHITILESSGSVLGKVKVSGGGRCNVTHACFDPKEFAQNYPRGHRELTGPFHHWQAQDTVDWFQDRGVILKTETDGRMFPVTDNSQTVIDCLLGEAKRAGVEIRMNCGLKSAMKKGDDSFDLTLMNGGLLEADCLLLATGGVRNGKGSVIAESLGHHPITGVPSLFSFHIRDDRLKGIAGVSLPSVQISTLSELKLSSSGPMLVTHEGLSGPAILKLSAWGAREFAARDYKFEIFIDWTDGMGRMEITDRFALNRQQCGRRTVFAGALFKIPQRLWERLVIHAGIPQDRHWFELRKIEEEALISGLTKSRFEVSGKSLNKEEFVTCGGVPCKEVDFRTMESKICKGLFFAGEILDIDGVTGGFNFQNAWTTGYLAGRAMAA